LKDEVEEEEEDGIMGLNAAGVNAMPLILVLVSVTTYFASSIILNSKWRMDGVDGGNEGVGKNNRCKTHVNLM
jgi:hypothetical protein